MSDLTREELNARLETIETRMDGRLSSIEQMIGAKFAELDASLHKANADTLKSVTGTMIGLGVAGLALMTLLINHGAPKASAPPAPIIITVPVQGAQLPAPDRPVKPAK